MQALSIDSMLNFLDAALFEFADSGSDASREIVSSLEQALGAALQGKQTVNDAHLERTKCLLRCAPLDAYPESGSRTALHAALLAYERSNPSLGIELAKLAVSVATDGAVWPVARRGHNLLAALLIDDGQPALAVQHAGQSIALAEQLGDALGKAAALTNLASGLFQQGLYRESINIARRVIEEPLASPNAPTVKAQAAGVLAEAALAVGETELAIIASQSACDSLPSIPGRATTNRLAALGIAVRANVVKGNMVAAREYLNQMRSDTKIEPSLRAQVNVELASVHVMLADGDVGTAIMALESLQPKTTTFLPLQRDRLSALIQAYQQANQPDKALIELSKLVDQLGNAHMAKLARYLQFVDQPLLTHLPGKDHASSFVRSVQQQQPNNDREKNVSASVTSSRESHVERQVSLERLAVSAELKEDAEGYHAFRVGRLSGLLGEALGYGTVFCRELELAARLHDIGKLSVPDALLLKPGPLSDVEWTAMRQHTLQGELVIGIASPVDFRLARQIAGGHHENWDGRGYPRMLAGERIPEVARIARFADVYDALTHARPYKHAWSHPDAMSWMKDQFGSMFDPRIGKTWLELMAKLHGEHRGALDQWLRTTATHSPILHERSMLNALIDADLG